MHIQWVVAIATRKMSRRAHFFVNWIFSVRCPNIGSLDTLNDIQVGHQKGKNAVEIKTEIEFELTLNVRCSGQNSVFNWFIFLEYSILWQFHGVDLWPFCIWIRYIVATWMELVGETKIAAWAVDVHLYLYIDSFANREKRTKTGCHIHNKYCVPSVCCKGGGNILTRKICKFTSGIGFERSTFIWTDTLTHTHLRVEIWIFNIFVKFCVDCRVNAIVCVLYLVHTNRKEGWEVRHASFCMACSRRNENGIQNTFYVITMRHVVHHFRRIHKQKSRKKGIA